jgi:cardiolipin synthase A/B
MHLPTLSWETLYGVVEWVIRIGALVVVPFRRKFTAAAWLLMIFFLPIPGLILFLMIGQPRFPKERIDRFKELRPCFEEVADALRNSEPRYRSAAAEFAERLGQFPATDGNQVDLIDDYDEVIARLIEDIDSAKRSVFLLVYIFADDKVGLSVIEALGRAVSRGVDCRVLIDPVGSLHWVRGTVKRLCDLGVRTRRTLPLRLIRGVTRRDMRNHRKLFIVDGRIGYAGSQNIVTKDFRPGITNRELVARCCGPVVAEMEAVFLGDWYLETGMAPPGSIKPSPTEGGAVLQLLPSGPEYPMQGFETLLVWQIHQARERAIIATPYFIPDQDVIAAFLTAAARGVEVDLVLSRVVDHPIVNLAQRSYYGDLLRAGVRIHLFNKFLLHAKNVTIDGELAIVGSSNVDLRSFTLNEEVSLLLHDPASVAALEAVQRSYIVDSELLDYDGWTKRGRAIMVAENLARLVSPVL